MDCRKALLIMTVLALFGCQKREPLTEEKANLLIAGAQLHTEPTYAEVPQVVKWNARLPKDDYDELSLRTFHNLEAAGLVTVKDISAGGTTAYQAKVTSKGFPLLGTAPSWRGPVYRGLICYKRYDGLRNFVRHPSEPTIGTGDLYWHYGSPTALYPMFETKINKPLDKPFTSLVSFYYKDYNWHFDVMVKKSQAGT